MLKLKFEPLPLSGAYRIEPEIIRDERGMFARSWDKKIFKEKGLNPRMIQCNISFNYKRGTLRGMHFQGAPYPEAKLVRCTQGAIFDVIVDLRPSSETFKQWYGEELTQDKRNMFYVPEGFGHGFLTLTDDAEVFYQMTEYYHEDLARGFRWNDEEVGIDWPFQPEIISDRDRSLPTLEKCSAEQLNMTEGEL